MAKRVKRESGTPRRSPGYCAVGVLTFRYVQLASGAGPETPNVLKFVDKILDPSDSLAMNTQQLEVWAQPDFEEISACMECTAYALTTSAE